MKTVLYILAVLAVIITGYNTRGLFTPGRVTADTVTASNKYDGDCPVPPAYATVGRCADKCPNQSDTLLGFDPKTGAAICQAAQPANVNQSPQTVDVAPANVNGFTGK